MFRWPSKARPWLEAADFPGACGRIVASNAGLVGALGVLFYTAYGMNDWAQGAPWVVLAWDLAAGLLAAVAVVLWLADRIPEQRANAVVALLTLAPVIPMSVATTLADPARFDRTTFMLLFIAAGVLVLSWRWFGALGVALVAAWALLELRVGGSLREGALEFIMPGLALGILFQAYRLRSHRTMYAMHRAERERAEALAESEARWRGLIENAPQGIALVDADARIQMVHNPASKTAASVVGTRVFEHLSPAEADRFRHLLSSIFTQDRTVSFEMPAQHEGATRWYSVSAGPIRRDEQVTGAILFFADVTERRKADEALVQTEKLRSLGTLVAGVAHEINNPLTYMQGNIELTLMDLEPLLPTLPPDARQAVEDALARQQQVLSGVERIEHITRSLKRVARPHSAPRTAESVAPVISSVMTIAASRFPASCHVDVQVDAKGLVYVDHSELGQVLLNLVFNAADAVATVKAPRIAVRAVDEEAGGVRITVTDNGPGIPEAVQQNLFTPFQTTKPEGTGLGLAIGRRIVHDQGGTLTYVTGGSGTTFIVRLPPAPASVGASSTRAADEGGPPHAAPPAHEATLGA